MTFAFHQLRIADEGRIQIARRMPKGGNGIRPAGPARPSEIIAQGSDIIRIVLAQAGTRRGGACGRDSKCAHSLNSQSQARHYVARAGLEAATPAMGTKKSPGTETGARPEAVVSDQPALLQQPYTIGRNRHALRRFASAHQPPAYLGIVDRRIYAIGCVPQVERSSIDVPWLRPAPGEFVDLGDDFENQGRNAVACFPVHHHQASTAPPKVPWSLQCTVTEGETSPWRGESSVRHAQRAYGTAWTDRNEVASMFARGLNAIPEGGGVLISTIAPASAIIAGPGRHSVYLGEHEYVVDRRQLTEVVVLERFELS